MSRLEEFDLWIRHQCVEKCNHWVSNQLAFSIDQFELIGWQWAFPETRFPRWSLKSPATNCNYHKLQFLLDESENDNLTTAKCRPWIILSKRSSLDHLTFMYPIMDSRLTLFVGFIVSHSSSETFSDSFNSSKIFLSSPDIRTCNSSFRWQSKPNCKQWINIYVIHCRCTYLYLLVADKYYTGCAVLNATQ